jgi:hypothetical protein
MKRLQISIAALILVIVVLAFVLTALRTASDLWYSALYTFSAAILLTSVVASRFRRGNERAFWFGFAVFGWGFFLLGSGPWLTPFPGRGLRPTSTINHQLLTSKLIIALVPRLRKDTNDLQTIDHITANTIYIAHLVVTLAIAVLGGLLAIMMRRKRAIALTLKSAAALAVLGLLTILVSSIDLGRPADRFFPAAALDDDDPFPITEPWYSAQLSAMREPSLWMLSQGDKDAIAYRLLWLPSFDHPVCVRINWMSDGLRLHAKVLDGDGGYDPGQLAIERDILLNDEQIDALSQKLKQIAFWEMPTRVGTAGLDTDGDQLVLEGVSGRLYHVVDRATPEVGFKDLCRYLLDLTGLQMQDTWEKYHESEARAEIETKSLTAPAPCQLFGPTTVLGFAQYRWWHEVVDQTGVPAAFIRGAEHCGEIEYDIRVTGQQWNRNGRKAIVNIPGINFAVRAALGTRDECEIIAGRQRPVHRQTPAS